MLKAEKFMTRDVIVVPQTMHIHEAMNIIVSRNVSGIPVVDEEMKLIGIISETDMIQAFNKGVYKCSETVSQYMSKQVTSFKPEDSASKICDFFKAHPVRRVPIVNEQNQVVGVVSRRDLIRLFLVVNEPV